jgi:hypothetical protein
MLSTCRRSWISSFSRGRQVSISLYINNSLSWKLILCADPVQARETGICPVREELYAQCFDELIREVTINCAERGLLLLRVRDEMRMTIAAYQVTP